MATYLITSYSAADKPSAHLIDEAEVTPTGAYLPLPDGSTVLISGTAIDYWYKRLRDAGVKRYQKESAVGD